jgi:hypothetical protein
MVNSTEKTQEVPMSVRMERVLSAVKRMPFADRLQLLVKAGLMTEIEAQQTLERRASNKKDRAQAKGRRTPSTKKDLKPRTG